MNRIAVALGGALVAAGLSVGAYAHDGAHGGSAEGKAVTLQGELIDTACFVSSDGDAKGKDHASCAQKCMKSGIPAGILPEGKKADDAMFLLTSPVALAPYAGQTIKVEGTAYADKHAIDVKKFYVKEGNGWKEVMLMDEHHKMGGGAQDEHAGHDHATTGK